MSNGSDLIPSEDGVSADLFRTITKDLKRLGFAVPTVRANPTYPPTIYGDERFVREALRFFDAHPWAGHYSIEISHETLRRLRNLRLVGSVQHPPSHAYNSGMEIIVYPKGPHLLVFRREYFQPSQEREKTAFVYGTDKPIPAALLVPNTVIPPDVLADPVRLEAWAASQWKQWHDDMGKGHAKRGTLQFGPVPPGLVKSIFLP